MSEIYFKDLNISYEINGKELAVVKDLNLKIQEDIITVVLGKSGCGKTTLLKAFMGLIPIKSGEITKNSLKIAYVFQEPRLMDWLNVYENIIFGLKKEEINRDDILSLIKMVGLEDFTKAYPRQLSGGMQSRVSLIRALAFKANYILMDEPFAALDYFTRLDMQRQLLRLKKINNFGVLFVTHSIEEAINIADEILIMDGGIIKRKIEKTEIKEKNLLLLRNEILKSFKEDLK